MVRGLQQDIGHVFTGLEAMTCLTDTVDLIVGVITYTVEVSNEEFATWVGDLGSAVAQKTVDDLDMLRTLTGSRISVRGGLPDTQISRAI